MNYTKTHTVGGQCPSIFRRLTGWLLASIGFVALAASAGAQTATITGRIMNETTGEYLKYAQVQVVGSDKSATSEDEGVYTLANVPAGEVKLSVTYTGLDLQEVTVVVPASGTVKQDVSLSSASLGEVITLGAFNVASAREGNAKAIVEQRQALNMKTVISADAFGDVSEGNVGEFLRLLPGVTVDYVDNDVRTVRIRGLPGKYALTTMDGHAIATAGSADINTGRQFELEQVSLTSLDTVETAKSPTPDMSTPGLAGNTNILSKSAFSQKGRSIKYSAAVAMNQNDMTLKKTNGPADKDTYKLFPVFNAEWIDTLLDGKLGIVLSAGHSSSYNVQNAFIGSYTFDRNPYNNTTETPLLTAINLQNGPKTTDRDSLLLNLEYKVTDDLKFALRTSYGNYIAPFHNRNWTINASTQAQLLSTATNTTGGWPGPGGEFAGNFRTGVYSGPTGANYTSSGNSTYASVTGSNLRKAGGTFVISPAMTWKINDFKIDAGASYSRSKSFYRAGSEGFFSQVDARMNGIGWQWSKTGDDVDYLIKQTSGTGSMLDIANYNASVQAINEIRDGNDRVWTANLDGTWDRSDWSIPTTFKAGFNSTLKVLDIERWTRRWDINTNPLTGPIINLGDFRDPYDTINGNGVILEDLNGNRGPMPSTNKWALWQNFQGYGNEDGLSQTAAGPYRAQANANLRNKLQNMWDIEETIQAAYVMATVKPMAKLSLVAGLRFERTETSGRSFDDMGMGKSLVAVGFTTTQAFNSTTQGGLTTTARNAIATANNDQGMNYVYYRYGSRTTREQSYSTALPSVQGKYNISKNLLVRGAYYASLLRPDFQHAVGGITVSDPADATPNTYTFTIRNSELKPETANNFDVSIEYYMEPVGLISLAGFYKEVKDIQVNFTQNVDLNDLPEAVTGLGLGTIDQASRISTFVNGPKTSVSGLELAYQQELTFLPGALKGLGVTANYTYIRPDDDRLWALVANAGDGLSKHAFNFVLRYKLNKFNAQVTATWADQKIRAISNLVLNSSGELTPTTDANGNYGVNSNVQEIIRDRVQLNMNLNYKLHRRATLFLNISNIVNEPQYRYQEQETYITRHGNYGAGFTLGVKGSF